MNKTESIEIRIRELPQLFNSLDPSPFRARDLDVDAEEFIVDWARELPEGSPLRIVVYLPEKEALAANEQGLAEAVRNYFAYRTRILERDISELFRIGRRHLWVGVSVLSACLVASQLSRGFLTVQPFAQIVEESLIIVGWVANWKPIEIFLYDWWPLKRRTALYERLRDAELVLNLDTEAPG